VPNVSININPASVNVNGTADGTVNLNNPPASGYTSAEFTCTYNQALIQINNFLAGGVFGANPVMVVNGPASGSFIVAIAGSNGSEATASGVAFTFDILALQAGQASVQCTVRVSDGSDTLATIPSTPASITVATPQGNLVGQALASKSVTVSLYNADTTLATSAVVNPDGTFNLSALAGTYTVIASAEGYLEAQGAPIITSGATTTMQTVILLAGDIDGNNTIDQFDAMTIGMNYNLAAPTAADLNNDGTINILDLELLASNYGQSGALAWSTQ
jgi:minor extracellular serine protease Vpr